MIWDKLQEIIQSNKTFLISSHVSPDGDCIGSQLAFCWYLTSLGKEVVVFDSDPVPTKFEFLQGTEVITTEKPDRSFDVLVILDSSNSDRLGWDGFRDIAKTVVNIDHHRDNTRFGDFNHVVGDAAATGQIIYNFLDECSIRYPEHVAELLYTAIMTDTGGLRFSNTNGKVLRMCADLADNGADCARVYKLVYASHSPQGLMLQAKIWSTLTFHVDGRVCSVEMPLSLIDELGANYGDSEGMADTTILAGGVDVGLFVKYSDTQTHFSLRSDGTVNVGRIARNVSKGGGHSSAAGCTIDLPVAEAKRVMLEAIEKELVGIERIPEHRQTAGPELLRHSA